MANTDYESKYGGDFTPHAVLDSHMQWLTDRFTYVDLNDPTFEGIAVGDSILIDDEFMSITAIDSGSRSIGVKRGCADTTPVHHAVGADIWFLTNTNSTMKEYAGSDEIGTKILPFIPSGQTLEIDRAEPERVKFNFRFARPYPPGQMRANGGRWFNLAQLTAENPVLSLTWVHRNRVLQADQLVGHEEAALAREAGVTYLFRVYNHMGELVRTETGFAGQTATYSWAQAVNDFGVPLSQGGLLYTGRIEFYSALPGYESWTGYSIPLQLSSRTPYMYAMQVGEQSAAVNPERAMMPSMALATFAEQTAAEEHMATQHTMLAGVVGEEVGQLTSFFTQLRRLVFEAPYTYLLRKGFPATTHRVLTMSARPDDRMTDNHYVYGRTDLGQPLVQYDYPPFTPWLVTTEPLAPLAESATYSLTSNTDGVSLDAVRPGQMAAINGEIVKVVSITLDRITVLRGCVDTVPAHQPSGARIWFFEAAAGLNQRDASWPVGAVVDTRVVPAVYGPALDPELAPSDSLEMHNRTSRPFPPGQMKINGNPWYEGAAAAPNTNLVFTWVQRNRMSQGTNVLDHTAANVNHEYGTRYRIKLALKRAGPNGKPVEVIIRQLFVEGTAFTYTYEMAYADGLRAASILKACGYVIVPLYIDAVRDDLENWQGYSVPMRLPAQACPINQAPGGGQGPSPTPPGGGSGGGTGGGGGNGGGHHGDGGEHGGSNPGDPNAPDPQPPTIPPTWPPVPPDDIDPIQPGEPNPDDKEPEPGDTGEHWDFTWDIHWDAFRRHGDNNQGEG